MGITRAKGFGPFAGTEGSEVREWSGPEWYEFHKVLSAPRSLARGGSPRGNMMNCASL